MNFDRVLVLYRTAGPSAVSRQSISLADSFLVVIPSPISRALEHLHRPDQRCEYRAPPPHHSMSGLSSVGNLPEMGGLRCCPCTWTPYDVMSWGNICTCTRSVIDSQVKCSIYYLLGRFGDIAAWIELTVVYDGLHTLHVQHRLMRFGVIGHPTKVGPSQQI